MNSILITDKQDYKLTEMCKKLFSEIVIFTGFGINGVHVPEHVLNTPKDLEWSTEWNLKYLVDSNGKDIHWFEFCMTHLCDKIANNLTNEMCTGMPQYYDESEKLDWNSQSLISMLKEYHPIDYLYEEFKKLN